MTKLKSYTIQQATLSKQSSMIEYSNHETDIFGVSFGRLNINSGFTAWEELKEEVASSSYRFIRIKIKNPNNIALERVLSLTGKVHLLEILRAYTTYSLQGIHLEDMADDLTYIKVDESSREQLLQTILDTYEDVPFGTYTPASVLEKIAPSLQLHCLSQYFYQNYYGNHESKVSYLIYNPQREVCGCVMIDFSEHESYSYYVGVKKAFRKNNILSKSIHFIHRTTQARHLEFAKGSARLHNLYSQKAFDKSGMRCEGYDWIFLAERGKIRC